MPSSRYGLQFCGTFAANGKTERFRKSGFFLLDENTDTYRLFDAIV